MFLKRESEKSKQHILPVHYVNVRSRNYSVRYTFIMTRKTLLRTMPMHPNTGTALYICTFMCIGLSMHPMVNGYVSLF